jgi:Leucine-rich repeat (LRR) protein
VNFVKLESLEELIIRNTKITKFPDFSSLKNLKKLDLKGNALSKLEIQEIQKQLPNTKIIY